MGSQIQPIAAPGIEVILHSHGTTNALALSDGPVLLKGPSAINRGLISPGADVNVVGATVALMTAFVLSI